MSDSRRVVLLAAIAAAFTTLAPLATPAQAQSYAEVFDRTRSKVCKIYGAGGFRGLEAYQSGFVVSADGYVVTVWSYVLDTNYVTVTLDDGRRYDQAELVGFDPRLELAVLKIPATGLPHFDLDAADEARPGSKVLAFSNLYGVATGNEPVSMQHGVVAVKTRLEARRGVFETSYRGDVYVLDAMTNNPGAAGGALTDRRGRLLGMIGKELRNSLTNTWLNYAVPVSEIDKTIEDIIAGRHLPTENDEPLIDPEFAHSPHKLGILMVPDILERTPPFVDAVVGKSPASQAGLRPNDLILFVNGRVVQSCKTLRQELARLDSAEPVRLSVLRDQQLIEVELRPEDQ